MEQENRRTLPATHPGEPHALGVDVDGGEPIEQPGNREVAPTVGAVARRAWIVRHCRPRHFRNSTSASAVSAGRSSGSQWAQSAILPPETFSANSSNMATIVGP